LPLSKDYMYLGLLCTISIPVSIHFRIVRAHKVFPNLPMHDDTNPTKVDKFYFHVQFSNEHCRRKTFIRAMVSNKLDSEWETTRDILAVSFISSNTLFNRYHWHLAEDF
jgi:hypothetical protein